MGGGAAAHAKMHQPVFFWWRLKVVCAVPGMIQCSWRRCTTQWLGTRGAIGQEEGDPGYPKAFPSLSMSHSPPPNCCGTLFLTCFAACLHKHPTFQLFLNPSPLQPQHGQCSLEQVGAFAPWLSRETVHLLEGPLVFLEKARNASKLESPTTCKQLELVHLIAGVCLALLLDGGGGCKGWGKKDGEKGEGVRMGNVRWEESQAGAPHPAAREMGKAEFSIGVGRGAWERWKQAVLAGWWLFTERCRHGAGCTQSCRVPSRDAGRRWLELVFVMHLFGFPEPKGCF